jgi:hypothetical protein
VTFIREVTGTQNRLLSNVQRAPCLIPPLAR